MVSLDVLTVQFLLEYLSQYNWLQGQCRLRVHKIMVVGIKILQKQRRFALLEVNSKQTIFMMPTITPMNLQNCQV